MKALSLEIEWMHLCNLGTDFQCRSSLFAIQCVLKLEHGANLTFGTNLWKSGSLGSTSDLWTGVLLWLQEIEMTEARGLREEERYIVWIQGFHFSNNYRLQCIGMIFTELFLHFTWQGAHSTNKILLKLQMNLLLVWWD